MFGHEQSHNRKSKHGHYMYIHTNWYSYKQEWYRIYMPFSSQRCAQTTRRTFKSMQEDTNKYDCIASRHIYVLGICFCVSQTDINIWFLVKEAAKPIRRNCMAKLIFRRKNLLEAVQSYVRHMTINWIVLCFQESEIWQYVCVFQLFEFAFNISLYRMYRTDGVYIKNIKMYGVMLECFDMTWSTCLDGPRGGGTHLMFSVVYISGF